MSFQSQPPKSSGDSFVEDSNPGLRFQDWSVVGTRTFTPDDLTEVVGSFSMSEGDDTLWTRITLLSPAEPWPWSYGILGFKTSNGYELGSVKAYPEVESEVFRLGIGRPPYERTGQLTFEPRSFNLAWIRNGYPLTLKFECSSGTTSGGSGGFDVVNSFVRASDGSGLPLVQVDFS
jgi:hypothetical protein